jgi:hypothetical protein
LDKIASYWHKDLQTEWKHNVDYIEVLKSRYRSNEAVPPLLVTKPNKDGIHLIVNGHHRYLAAQELGRAHVEVVILPMSFEETEELRKAEWLLKEFDKKTGYEYGMTTFLNDYVAFKFNRFYRNDFQRHLRKRHRSLLSRANRAQRRFVKLFEDPIRRLRKRWAAARLRKGSAASAGMAASSSNENKSKAA